MSAAIGSLLKDAAQYLSSELSVPLSSSLTDLHLDQDSQSHAQVRHIPRRHAVESQLILRIFNMKHFG